MYLAIGEEQREFCVHKNLLVSASQYFADLVANVPALQPMSIDHGFFRSNFFAQSRYGTPESTMRGFGERLSTGPVFESSPAVSVIWLQAESPAMFELFVLWLYQRSVGLVRLVDEVSAHRAGGVKATSKICRSIGLPQNLAELHVFAAKVGIDELQDVALDALQDVFLRCEWQATPKFIRFVFECYDPENAYRLRQWTVAMMAWTLAATGTDLLSLCFAASKNRSKKSPREQHPSLSNHHQKQPIPEFVRRFSAILSDIPDLLKDFVDHVSKLSRLKGSAAQKNPTIRLPTNCMKTDGRQYGFRLCSFHSHRKEVGQGECPHQFMYRMPGVSCGHDFTPEAA